MAGYHDELVRMLAAFQLADHIETGSVRKLLRREHHPHSHRTLRCERRDQIGVFGGDRGSWNFGRILGVISLSRMGQTKLRAADRADERRDGAESGGSAGRLGAILHGLTVSLAAMALDS